MRTGHPTHGLAATGFGPTTLKVLALAALTGLTSIIVSSAAASDAPTTAEAEQSAAIVAAVELVPLEPAAEARVPEAEAPASRPKETVVARGSASYYAARFNGRRTANGERFNNADMTAAHRTLPFGTRVRVTALATGRSVVVRINDRGPFYAGRIIDLSRAAAAELGLIVRGHGKVELAVLED
jgi:rare lipoprotein A